MADTTGDLEMVKPETAQAETQWDRIAASKEFKVLRSIVLEALVVGFGAAVIGLLGGLLIAQGLQALFKAVGADLPDTGSVIKSRTIIVALVVGTVVTVIASLAPALRSTRIAPVVALREGLVEQRRRRAHPHDHRRAARASSAWRCCSSACSATPRAAARPRSWASARSSSSWPSRCSARSSCARSRRWSGGRCRRSSGSPDAWRGRTRCATPDARR